MRQLFEAIDNCKDGSLNVVLTALDGEYLGEKALVSDESLFGRAVMKASFQRMKKQSVRCRTAAWLQ